MAGGNLESSAPLGACRQEGESLHQGGGRTKSREVSCCSSVWKKRSKMEDKKVQMLPGIWNGLLGSELDGE